MQNLIQNISRHKSTTVALPPVQDYLSLLLFFSLSLSLSLSLRRSDLGNFGRVKNLKLFFAVDYIRKIHINIISND